MSIWHLSVARYSDNIGRTVQFMNLLTAHFSAPSCQMLCTATDLLSAQEL